MWNYGMGWGMSWGMWVVMGVGTLAFWLLVAWVVRLVIQGREASDGARRDAAPGAEPLRLLDERLAKGEIDAEEYQRTRRLLIEHR